jgi:CRISP-associated protein Cas1
LINIPFRMFKVQLRLKRDCSFPFYHGLQLYSLCCNIFDKHPLGPDILIHPAESGMINFHQDDFYNFGLTFLGNNPVNIQELANSMEDVFKSPEKGDIAQFYTLNEITNIDIIAPEYFNINNEISLRFITPLRHHRRKKEQGKSFFDPSYFDPDYFLERLYYRVQDISAYLGIPLDKEVITHFPKCRLLQKNFMWVDAPSNDTIGGIIGTVKFSGELDELWTRILWLGQFFHSGRNSSFGFGKYLIENTAMNTPVIGHAKNFLERAVDKENILEAFKLLNKNTGTDEYKLINEPGNDSGNLIDNLTLNVLNNEYKPSHLKGMNIPKKNGKYRSLAIPDFRDRLLQKAVNNIIMPSIDRLLEESAFAYRKGLSRLSAAKTINRARQEGFKYAVKSDIECFFDNVDWKILFNKLDILFHDDPLLKILQEWITQPVDYNGRVIIRDRGLPQGCVVSPLFANLYLDEFDEILGNNFKLVRYADDFIIMCHTKSEVEEAIKDAEKSLGKLHLELNKDKTSVNTFEHDFRYLGYLFHQSEITDITSNKKEPDSAARLVPNSNAFGKSWLLYINPENIIPADQLKKQQKPEIKKISEPAGRRNKYPLYINGTTNEVRLEGKTLVIKETENPKGEEKKIPFEQIHSLVLMGLVRITFAAIVILNLKNIPIYFTNQNGRLYLSLPVEPKNYKYWLRQQHLAEDDDFTIDFARQVIKAKIHNSKATLSKTGTEMTGTLNSMNSFLEMLGDCASIDVLRGIEGKASAVYFEGYRKLFSPEWKFEGRVKHPPSDPVNCMLSICYMVLFNHIATALQIAGLNPDIGFYHISRGRYPALASDIVEEFRFIADRCVLYVINRNIISLNDFTFNENEKYPCSMNNEARIKLIRQMELRLCETFTPPESDDKIIYFNYFYFKAGSILDLVKERDKQYEPLMVR